MSAKPKQPKKPFFRRISTYVMLTALGTPLLLAGTAWFLTRPERLARAVESALGENIHGKVHIGKAHLHWSGKLVVEDFTLDLADGQAPFARVLEAPRATITLSRRELFRLQVLVKGIEMDAPVLSVVEDPANDRVNLAGLGVKETGGPPQKIPLPFFKLNKGTIAFATLAKDGKTAKPIATWELEGTITPTGFQAGKADFHAFHPDIGKRADVSGEFDLAAMEAKCRLANGTLRPEMALLVPRGARKWWRTFSATGEIPRLEAACDWKDGFHLVSGDLQVKDMALHPNLRPMLGDLGDLQNTPVAEVMVSAADSLWFDRIDGMARVKDDVLYLPDLRATAHGDDLGIGTVKADLSGHLNLTGTNKWGLAFTTEKFVLADNIPILDVFPDVRAIYRRFNPSGTFRVSGRAESTGLDAVPELEATVELVDAKANYSVRPYPVEHVSGTLRATLDKLVIENLRGKGVAGGEVTVNGKIAPLTDAAGADIEVELEGVPYGEEILKAMGPKTAAAVRRFFSAEATEKLRARGLSAPLPGGEINAVLKITRDKGENGRWGIAADLDAEGLQVILPAWPYPMKITGGHILANETHVGAGNFIEEAGESDLSGEGPTGGTIVLALAADDAKGTGDFGWRLAVKKAQLPVDAWFYAALPPKAEQAARKIGVTGALAAAGILEESAGSKNGDGLRIDLRGRLRDGSADPFASGYKLENLAMDMTLREGELVIHEASATHGNTRFEAAEKVAWAPAFSSELSVKARDLAFTPDLGLLTPPDSAARRKVAEAFARWKFEGDGDGELAWTVGPGKGAGAPETDDLRIVVRPKTLSMESPLGHPERLRLEDMAGAVTLAGETVALAGVRGAFDGGVLSASGELRPKTQDGKESLDADLRLSGYVEADLGSLPGTVAALLPAAARKAVAEARADGEVRVRDGRLALRGDRATFDAKLSSHDLDFDLGLPFRNAAGRVDLKAQTEGARTLMDAGIALDETGMYGRRLSDGRTEAKITPEGWAMPRFTARLAGGLLTGSAVGRFETKGTDKAAGKPAAWAADMDLTDAAFAGVKAPEAWDEARDGRKDGELGARFRLTGTGSGFGQLLGEGDFFVKGANFEVGGAKWRLVEFLNGIKPGSGGIDAAHGRFTADGRRLHVDQAELTSPGGLSIVGKGVVLLPDARLRLRLATRNDQKGWLAQIAKHVAVPFFNEFLDIRVEGTLTDPAVTTNAFADVRRVFEELMPGGSEKKRKWRR